MTPHQKAVDAVNARLERLQANLREAKVESAQHFLLQSLVVTIGLAEALNDYATTVGAYAKRRHAEVKKENETCATRHTDLLKSGEALLEQLKANPTDRSLRKEIAATQQKMESVQKSVRRSANALQRELAPSLAMIDEMAVCIRRFSESDQVDALKRVLKSAIGHARQLYASHPLPAKGIIDALAWETAALAELGQATDFYDAYARAGFQIAVALALITLAVSETPPASATEATIQANAAVAARIKEITARFSAP